MSFDRPGLPHPGRELDPAVEDTFREEGVEITEDEYDVPEHPGGRSAGPQPNPPRRPPHNPPPQDTAPQDTAPHDTAPHDTAPED
ncbi:hypothetical protein [Kribbella sp. NPDC004875]|uniref:hypothetical protein n=1 Tax=Kribbella sp. NPDC004875 TaxID=3364107 RepID=UPI00369AAA20